MPLPRLSRSQCAKPFVCLLCVLCASLIGSELPAGELPGAKPLTEQGDLAAKMVQGIDAYLMRELEKAAKGGADKWHVITESRTTGENPRRH